MGAFGRESSFDVKVEPDEVLLRIVRSGAERREIAVHLHYYLLADILKELGQGIARGEIDDLHLRPYARPHRPWRRASATQPEASIVVRQAASSLWPAGTIHRS
jgi:hypothetical protein